MSFWSYFVQKLYRSSSVADEPHLLLIRLNRAI